MIFRTLFYYLDHCVWPEGNPRQTQKSFIMRWCRKRQKELDMSSESTSLSFLQDLKAVCNHVKLDVSPRILYCALWILAMGLADILGIADLHCRKVESTKWLKHKLRATLGGQQFEQTEGRSGFPLPLRFAGGRLEFVMQVFGDSRAMFIDSRKTF